MKEKSAKERYQVYVVRNFIAVDVWMFVDYRKDESELKLERKKVSE